MWRQSAITVSHFGEHKRMHLESSKQNYYIISLRAIIKAIFTSGTGSLREPYHKLCPAGWKSLLNYHIYMSCSRDPLCTRMHTFIILKARTTFEFVSTRFSLSFFLFPLFVLHTRCRQRHVTILRKCWPTSAYMLIYGCNHDYARVHLVIWSLKNPAKMAEKWPRFRGPWQSWELAWTMNRVDRLRTSADKRMWSGRRAVVLQTGRRAGLLGVKLGCPRSRCRAVVSDVLCVRS